MEKVWEELRVEGGKGMGGFKIVVSEWDETKEWKVVRECGILRMEVVKD